MTDLFNLVKLETFIFNDTQIKDKIIQLNNSVKYKITELDVVFELYKDKGIITKEEYTNEIIQYLYNNYFDSKDKINSVIEENKSWFYDQYNKAVNNKKLYYHAVQYCRNQLSGFLRLKPVEDNDDDEDDIDDSLF